MNTSTSTSTSTVINNKKEEQKQSLLINSICFRDILILYNIIMAQ